MDRGPLTFRDNFLSIYQSWAADVARRSGTGAFESDAKPKEVAAAEIAAAQFVLRSKVDAGLKIEPRDTAVLDRFVFEEMSVPENAKVCAALALRLLWAKVSGDEATAAQIQNEELPASKCDSKWVETIQEYLAYFGMNGSQRKIGYLRPRDVGPGVITIKANARIGMVGDWGTGTTPAKRILHQLNQQGADILIHLGDIYYAGTEQECRINFENVVNSEFGRATRDIPVYTLAGNHDMYSGGAGYYDLIKRLNKAPLTQPASFFCLRAEDNSWQFLAMDTGQHDHNPNPLSHSVTFVEEEELEWHEARIREFPGKTILLSHHQLFSAFSEISPAAENNRFPAYNPNLKAALDRFQAKGKSVSAWFWGHEHNLCIYQTHLGLSRGRCLGHSAIPVFLEDKPYDVSQEVDDPPKFCDAAKLTTQGQIYAHGFAILALSGQALSVDYFEDNNGVVQKKYSETID